MSKNKITLHSKHRDDAKKYLSELALRNRDIWTEKEKIVFNEMIQNAFDEEKRYLGLPVHKWSLPRMGTKTTMEVHDAIELIQMNNHHVDIMRYALMVRPKVKKSWWRKLVDWVLSLNWEGKL